MLESSVVILGDSLAYKKLKTF